MVQRAAPSVSPHSLEILESRIAPAVFTVTSAAEDGPGSLRQAVLDANANASPDLILFHLPAGVDTIRLTSQISITDNLMISGPGADKLTLSGDHLSRIFKIENDAIAGHAFGVTLQNLAFENGSDPNDNNSPPTYEGGGAILSYQSLTLDHCIIANNHSGGNGGGIYIVTADAGTGLLIDQCQFNGNTAAEAGGGIAASTRGNIYVIESMLTGNSAQDGGGASLTIASSQDNTGDLWISHSTVANNHAAASGGGLALANLRNLYVPDSTSFAAIYQSTLTNNSAATEGGGVVFSAGNGAVVSSSLNGNQAGTRGGALSETGQVFFLTDSLVQQNHTVDSMGEGGGGLYLFGAYGSSVTVTQSTFDSNHSASSGGGLFVSGVLGQLRGLHFQGNSADGGSGGAIYSYKPTLSLTTSDFNKNRSTADGGAIFVRGIVNNVSSNLIPDQLSLESLSFDSNQAAGEGGALATEGDLSMSIYRVAATGNVAGTGGGGLYVHSNDKVFLNSLLLTGNNTSQGDGGGANFAAPSIKFLDHAIISNNQAAGHGGGIAVSEGSLVLSNARIEENSAGLSAGGLFAAQGALVGGLPSPFVVIAHNNSQDGSQQSFAVLDPTEYLYLPMVRVVTSAADDGQAGTLRQVIEASNRSVAPDQIVFQLPVGTKQITLTSEIRITDDVTIIGQGPNGFIISGGDTNRIFDIDDGSSLTSRAVVLDGLNLQHGYGAGDPSGYSTSGSGGAILSSENLTVRNSNISNNLSGDRGGGIAETGSLNSGRLTIVNSTISNNMAAYSGGGIYAEISGSVLLEDSFLSGNRAMRSEGGGASILLAPEGSGSISVLNCTVSGNSAEAAGGLFLASAGYLTLATRPAFIANSIITGNTASSGGGGIFLVTGSTTITNSFVADNHAGEYGGGVVKSVFNGDLLIQGSSFTRNSTSETAGSAAERGGGALFLEDFPGTQTEISHSDFSNNSSAGFGGAIESSGAVLFVESTAFRFNSAQDGPGGAIHVSPGAYGRSPLYLVSSAFVGNAASGDGGAVSSEGNYLELNTVSFERNLAGGHGGAIALARAVQANLFNVLIEASGSNSSGGGLFTSATGDLQLQSVLFYQNQTLQGDGGGLALAGTGAKFLHEISISQNISAGHGGGLTISAGGPVLITDALIVDNRSGDTAGGVFAQAGTSVAIDPLSSIVAGNSSVDGSQRNF